MLFPYHYRVTRLSGLIAGNAGPPLDGSTWFLPLLFHHAGSAPAGCYALPFRGPPTRLYWFLRFRFLINNLLPPSAALRFPRTTLRFATALPVFLPFMDRAPFNDMWTTLWILDAVHRTDSGLRFALLYNAWFDRFANTDALLLACPFSATRTALTGDRQRLVTYPPQLILHHFTTTVGFLTADINAKQLWFRDPVLQSDTARLDWLIRFYCGTCYGSPCVAGSFRVAMRRRVASTRTIDARTFGLLAKFLDSTAPPLT